MPRNSDYYGHRSRERKSQNAGAVFFIILASVFVIAAAIFAFQYFESQIKKQELADTYQTAQKELDDAKKDRTQKQEQLDALTDELDKLQKAVDALSAQ